MGILKDIARNIRKRGLEDALNPKKWKIMANHIAGVDEIPLHEAEQIVYRAGRCKPCVDAGECLHCGCEIQGAIASKDNWCSDGKWTAVMDKEDWNQYKADAEITITVNQEIG